MSAGKGSTYRPVIGSKYRANWDRIFNKFKRSSCNGCVGDGYMGSWSQCIKCEDHSNYLDEKDAVVWTVFYDPHTNKVLCEYGDVSNSAEIGATVELLKGEGKNKDIHVKRVVKRRK